MQLQQIKTKVSISKDILEKIQNRRSITLDIGCGQFKKKGAVGLDIRPLPGVDIVHDFNQYPWPIPDESCSLITAAHVLEHIPKSGTNPQIHGLAKLLIKKGVLTQKEVDTFVGETQIFSYLMRFMDECWRVLRVGGQLALVLPYAGSVGFYQDPTHSSPISEATFFYFDPEHSAQLWSIYHPKPWEIEINTYQINGNLEVILGKRAMLEKYEKAKWA